MKRILTCCLLVITLLSCSKQSDQTPQGRFDRGLKEADRNELVKAESTFVQLIATDTASPLGELGLAQTFEKKLWWLDALSNYSKVLTKQPDNAQATAGAVRCYYAVGSYDDAARAALKWDSLDDRAYQPYYWQALAFIKTMSLGNAANALKKAEERGLDKQATRVLEARMDWLRSSFDDAMNTASQAVASGSNAPEFFVALADYYLERGIPDSAVMAARKGYETNPNSSSAWRYLEICGLSHDFWSARQLLKDWDARDKEKSVSTILHYQYAMMASEKSQILTLTDRLQETSPLALTTLVSSGLGQRLLYNERMSADYLDQALLVASAPQEFADYLGAFFGYSYARSYNRDGAAQQLRAVKGWRRSTTEYQATLFSQMTISGGDLMADSLMDSLLPIYGTDPAWLSAIGDAYAEAVGVPFFMGKRFYQKALEIGPRFRPAYVGMIKMAAATGAYQEALDAFDRYDQIGPVSPELAYLKAQSLARVGRAADGVALFKQTFAQFPADIIAARNFYLALDGIRARDQVRDFAQFIATSAKDNPDVHELAARALLDWNFGPEGLQAAQSGLKLEPDNLRLEAQVARGLYATGQKNESMKAFEEILTKDRSQGEAIQYYSLAIADTGGDTARADLMAQRALVMVPPDLFPAKNLARVRLIMRHYRDSREACLRAAIIAPNDPEVWYMMGICLLNEKLPNAKENLQKAITLGLAGDDLVQAQEALRRL